MRKLLFLSVAWTLLAASIGCHSSRTLWGSAAAPVGPPTAMPGPVPATTYAGAAAAASAPPALSAVAQPAIPGPAACPTGAPGPLPMLSGPQNYTPISGR